jgi:hypothetical protein
METKDNVISLFEYKLNKQRIKDNEVEAMRYALFMDQHSDDDSFINANEFEFTDSDD